MWATSYRNHYFRDTGGEKKRWQDVYKRQVADVLAVTFTAVLFSIQFKKTLKNVETA